MTFQKPSSKKYLWMISLLFSILPLSGLADLYPAQFQIPEMSNAPELDGILQEGEWAQCQQIEDFVYWTLDCYEHDPVTVFLGFDQENLYVSFKSWYSDPVMWERRYEEKKPIDSHLWGRNNVRIQLGNNDVSIHLMAAPSLSRSDYKNGDMNWNGNWEFATSVNEDHWIAEVKVPFSELDLEGPPLEEMWNLMLGRTHPADGRSSIWNGKVRFVKSALVHPIIKKWPDPVPGSNELEFKLDNADKEAKNVMCAIELIPFTGKPEFINQKGQGSNTQFILPMTKAPLHFKTTITVQPGAEILETLDYDLPEEGSYYATATCYSMEGEILMRNRGYWFELSPNRSSVQKLIAYVSEGIATSQYQSAKGALDLASRGETLLEELNDLLSEADEAWDSKTWKALTEKVDMMEVKVYQYLNKLHCSAYNNWNNDANYGFTATHSLNKIRRDGMYQERITDIVKISAARNEYESFQLVVLPFGNDIKSLNFSASDLVNENGDKISASDIKISYIEYNWINRQPSYLIDYLGWHPDPLMPFNAAVDIKGGEISRPFWITVYVPEDASPGIYTGTISCESEGESGPSVSVKLNVWDFELPTEPHLKTHTWDGMETFNDFYNVDEIPVEWYLNFCEVLLKNKLSPGFAGVNYVNQKPDADGNFDFSKVEQVLEFCMERGLTRYSMIQMRKGFYTPEEKKEVYHFVHEYAKFLRNKGWIDKALIEVWDEPTIVRLPAVIQRAKDLREMDPDLKLQLFAFGHKEFDFWKPEAKQYGLVDLIDIWAPWPLVESPESQANGVEIWSYFCTLARSNAPNFYTESPPIYKRSIAWHSWMFGIDAFEHWSTISYSRNTFPGKPVTEKWPNRLWDSRTYMNFHGEGQLVYPGPDGICIPSLRLEVFRDGMDDYEYLYLLKELIERCEKEHAEINLTEFRKLLRVEDYLLIKYPKELTFTQENTIRYPDQSERFFEARNKLANAIEKLQDILE
jgi:hypothetical protein